MHIQIKARLTGSGFAEEDQQVTISAEYRLGALSELLEVLAEDHPSDPDLGMGFNLAGVGGADIELGGHFTFWVDARKEDQDYGDTPAHEVAANKAVARLRAANFEATPYLVSVKYLDNSKGALKRWVDEITAGGQLVKEIVVGAPDAVGLPVQIFSVMVVGR